jgi:hypothetical protein
MVRHKLGAVALAVSPPNGQMRTTFFCVLVFLILASETCICAEGNPDYRFDSNGISRKVLENYLKHSITKTGLLEHHTLAADTGGQNPDKDDDIRLVLNIGAKLIGRAMYRWGREDALNNPLYREEAIRVAKKIHESDPDVVFQAFLCEVVTQQVNNIKVPAWAFEALEMPIEDRNFRHESIVYIDGVRRGGLSGVPDISRVEAKLWFIFLSGFYMEVGCEAFHLGQVNLMDHNDRDLTHWSEVIGHIRKLAKTKARRGWIILDAHTPRGHLVKDGKSLLDFNSFPLRVKEVVDKPMDGILEVGYTDSLYKRSRGCISPSGWECDSLPYLVEFDNFGMSQTPGTATLNSHFVWGYDEISWFYLKSDEERRAWLKYAYNWLRENDPNGFLQMPVGRVVTVMNPETDRRMSTRFRANPPSETIPNGKNLEGAIKELWK